MRGFIRLARGAAGAALSIGPGYESQPLGPNARYDQVAGYYLDLRRKAAAKLRPRVTGRGELHMPGPTVGPQRALGLHEWLLGGQNEALTPFLNEIRVLRARANEHDNMLLWPHNVSVPKYRQIGPFYSCMTQGQAASAFVRAYIATADDAWADAALGALRPLTGFTSGLVTTTEAGPVLEEAPTDPPSHILNGWVFALWGLWDVALALHEPDIRSLFDESAMTLARMLSEYDVGWWTRYSLFPPIAPDLSKPFYHTLHVAQMTPLFYMTQESVFADTAARWNAYDRAVNRVRAVAAKAPAVVREAWFRRQ